MPVFHAPETPYGKELWKWDHYEDESSPIDASVKGVRKRAFQPFPAMLYRVVERNPLKMEHEVAESSVQARLLEQRGFVTGGPAAALEAYDAQQREYAVLAANRAHGELRMSDKARAEAVAYESETLTHTPEIPAQPVKRRRGRPSKAQTETTHGSHE